MATTAASAITRFQAEEHPLVEDDEPTSARDHCLRLMHLKAYEEAIRFVAGRDVLDVGCNTGYGTVRLAHNAQSVVAVDVSARAIAAASARSVPSSVSFQTVDGATLPFRDRSFDVVTSFQVIEHVQDPTAYLTEIKRVLKPNGIALLTTPNATVRLDPGMSPWNPFHVREYRPEELRAELSTVFARVRIHGLFGVPTLYEGEMQRVRDAKRNAGPGPVWLRLAKVVIPKRIRSRLKASIGGTPQAAGRSPFLHYSTSDLFYASADSDLDRSMDLLAICEAS